MSYFKFSALLTHPLPAAGRQARNARFAPLCLQRGETSASGRGVSRGKHTTINCFNYLNPIGLRPFKKILIHLK